MTPTSPSLCPQCGSALPEDSQHGLCPRCVFAKAMHPTAPGMAVRFVPPDVDAVSAAFPQLEVIALIGSGGMGAVFKARQPQLDRLVALKILPSELAEQPGFSERFQREAQALAKLSHPHIVTIHDFGQAGGFYYLLMEFVDGVNLRQLLQTKRLTPKEALSIVPPVCEALQCAHDHGVVHRDIKPENLLIDKAGTVKIADFGIAKMLRSEGDPPTLDLASGVGEGEPASLPFGTPDYAAPEQSNGNADHRADIYSLGVVLYEMLTGERPKENITPPSKRVQVDIRIDEIVLRALEKTPELRFQTAADFRTQVETVAATPDSSRREDAQTSPTPAPLLKTANSYVSTPEWLSSMRGKFWVYSGKGTLVLTRDQLAFTDTQSGAPITIPLAAIRDVSLGNYPWLAKPIPLHYVSVTWVEGGITRCRHFTPNRGWFQPVWDTNPIVREWHEALRAAVTAATGTAPDETPAPPHRPTAGDLGWMALMFGLPMCLIGVVLLHFLLMSENPEPLWQSGWFLFAAVFAGIGLVRLMRRLMMGGGSSTPSQEASVAPGAPDGMAKPPPRWQGWDVWVIGLCLTTFGALWLERLWAQRLYQSIPSDSSEMNAPDIVLGSAIATVILIVGAASLWMLAKNIKADSGSRAASWKRQLGRSIVPLIAVIVLVRAFVVQSFWAATDAASPELPRGSLVVVWKLSRSFAPGELIAYIYKGRVHLGRIAEIGADTVVVSRNGTKPSTIPHAQIVGKVISVLWRVTPGVPEEKASLK